MLSELFIFALLIVLKDFCLKCFHHRMHMNAWKMNIVPCHLKRFMTEQALRSPVDYFQSWLHMRSRLMTQAMKNKSFYASFLQGTFPSRSNINRSTWTIWRWKHQTIPALICTLVL